MSLIMRSIVVTLALCLGVHSTASAQMRIDGAVGSTIAPTTVAANTLCMSKTTRDSYFAEVGANNPGAYTGGTSCASGTLRFDWNSTRVLFAVPLYGPNGSAAAPSYAFGSEVNTGMRWVGGAGGGVLVGAGVDVAWFNAAPGMQFRSDLFLKWSADGTITTAADLAIGRGGVGILNITDTNGTPDLNLNVNGAPTPSSCGDGAVATGSSNTSGRVTSSDATECTLTFSVSFAGNAADCFIANLTANRGFVSAASSTAFTVSSLTAGDDFMYWCAGR